MNFNFSDIFKIFGSAYKISFIVFICGVFLIFINDEIKQALYLKSFVKSYGLWLGIATLLSGAYILISSFEKIISYFKTNKYNSKHKEKLFINIKNLGIEEKKVLAHFLSQNKQISLFKFQYMKPDCIGHLEQMGIIHEISNEYGSYYFKISDDIWEILQDNWQKIFYEDEFHNRGSNEK